MSRCWFSNSVLPQEEMNEIVHYTQPALMQMAANNTKHNFDTCTFAENINYYYHLHSTYEAIEDASEDEHLK